MKKAFGQKVFDLISPETLLFLQNEPDQIQPVSEAQTQWLCGDISQNAIFLDHEMRPTMPVYPLILRQLNFVQNGPPLPLGWWDRSKKLLQGIANRGRQTSCELIVSAGKITLFAHDLFHRLVNIQNMHIHSRYPSMFDQIKRWRQRCNPTPENPSFGRVWAFVLSWTCLLTHSVFRKRCVWNGWNVCNKVSGYFVTSIERRIRSRGCKFSWSCARSLSGPRNCRDANWLELLMFDQSGPVYVIHTGEKSDILIRNQQTFGYISAPSVFNDHFIEFKTFYRPPSSFPVGPLVIRCLGCRTDTPAGARV